MEQHYFVKCGTNLKSDESGIPNTYEYIQCFDTNISVEDIIKKIKPTNVTNIDDGQMMELNNAKVIYKTNQLVYISAHSENTINQIAKLIKEV